MDKVFCECEHLREEHEILEHFGMDATHFGNCKNCKCKSFDPKINESVGGKHE